MLSLAAASRRCCVVNRDLLIAGTSQVAEYLERKPSSLSPARDSLIKKGLVYSAERGQIAFTVPHFGRYLRSQEV